LLRPHQTSHPPKPTLLRCNRPRNNKPPTSTQQEPDTGLQLPPQHPVYTRILQGRTTLSQPENTLWIPNWNRGRYLLKRVFRLNFFSMRNYYLLLVCSDDTYLLTLTLIQFDILI